MNEIITAGPLKFSEPNCPTRVGEIVENIEDIYSIPTPRLGMMVFVKNKGRHYTITSLKSAVIGGVEVPNAQVDTFEPVAIENVGNVDSLDGFTDNGIYQGYHVVSGEVFVLVVINNYAVAAQMGVPTISQFKYSVNMRGQVSFEQRMKDSAWGEWFKVNEPWIVSQLEEIERNLFDYINKCIKDVTDGIDPEKIDSLKDLIAWVEEHGGTVNALWESIEENAGRITSETKRAKQAEEELSDAIRLNHEDIKSLNTNKAERSDAMHYDTLGISTYPNKAEIYGRSISGTPRTFDFPAATTEKAGVMSAEDKKNLNSLGAYEYDALSVDRRTDGKAYYLSGLKVGDNYNGSVIDTSSYSITPIITLEKGQKVSYKSYAAGLNAVIITDVNNNVIFLSGAYTVANGEYTATDTCYIYCTAYTNQISSDSYHCTVSASGMKATVERLESHVNILQSKTESFMQGYRELFVNGTLNVEMEQGSWIGFGEVGDNYTEKTDSSSSVKHYKVQVNQGTKLKYRLYAEGKYNVVITDLNGTILHKVGDSSNWQNHTGEYIATEECVIYINEATLHATMEHSDYYAILVDKDIRPRIDIKASDSEIEIWHKLKKAFRAGGYDVYFEHATYTFKEIYDVWKEINHPHPEMPIGGGCNYYCNGATFISVDPDSGHVGSRATFGVVRSVQSFCLQDANIVCIGGTYCFHDEGQNKPGKYVHRYDNCKMQYISNEHTTYLAKCIGGGTGLDGEVIINNCTFVNDNTIVTNGRKADPVSWHGNLETSDPTKFSIEVRNCHFTGGFIAIGANERGQGDDFTVLLTGNSADKECLIVNTNKNTDGWKKGSLIERIWDNELRGAPNFALRSLFIAAGAEYNDTDQIIKKTAPWETEEKWVKNADGTYTYSEVPAIVDHLPKHYYLNGLGDITEEQMIEIYNAGKIENLNMVARYNNTNIRTNLPTTIAIRGDEGYGNYSLAAVCNSSKQLQVILLNSTSILYVSNSFYGAFSSCPNLEYIYPVLNVKNCTQANALNSFYNCRKLKHIELKDVNLSLNLSYCPNIFKSSILYIIQNATPTSAITITLHADAYARLANDADIVAALAAKPLVTLVSA